jgi:hypothetical protein
MSNNEEVKTPWIPEIMYEDGGEGISSHIPFIQTPLGEEMPKMLFIFESRDTGEFEPGLDGEELPVTQLDLHQYANMNYLKTVMDFVQYDNLRFALGLEPIRTAAAKGQKITSNVRVAVDDQQNDVDALDDSGNDNN